MLRMLAFASVVLIVPVGAQHAAPLAPPTAEWQEQIRDARAALTRKDAEAARAMFEAVRRSALQRREDEAGLAAVQMLALMSRSAGDWPKTEDWLAEALDYVGRLKGPKSVEAVAVMTDIGGVRRARENFDGAAAIFEHALGLCLAFGEPELPRTAQIATTLGLVHLERKDKQQAAPFLRLALDTWDKTLREDPELLPTLDALAALEREQSNYDQAAPLYERSLRIREIAFGPDSAELIVALDNLSYTYFGLLRFADAEPLYKRLLDLWIATGGPDHPMLALTLDKVAEFYAAQKRFAEADTMALRAATIRAKSFTESLRLRARLASELNRPDDAIALVDKALQVIDIAGLPKPEQKMLPAPKDAKQLPPSRPRNAKPKSSAR
ncbi:MAG TPA: tetratricopeptide repeat protein [Bryobacteraceae bacterium]|nr:tetratricopeptide repeat protein [Bryobacteraceae bacterium]